MFHELNLIKMKKLITLLALIATIAIKAQAPQGFNYQATIRNNSGQLLLNQDVLVKFNILQNSAAGDIVYSETQTANTDDLGQINLVVGQGTPPTGTFSTINWGSGTYYLGIELNTGTGYVAMGTTQLLSVPFALYAEKSGSSATPATNGLNALIKTTDEPAGVNCTSGGTKLEVGLDADKNGVLDDSEVNATQTKYVCNGINSQNTSSGSTNYNLNVTDVNIPLVKYSCETNGGPLENVIAASGSWWTLPSAVGWDSCYTSPNGLWWQGCSNAPLSTNKPSLCSIQISSPIPSQIKHNYNNINANKVKYTIKTIGQCFDTKITFKFYDANDNIIPSFVEYNRGIKTSTQYGSIYEPINTNYLSSNNTQTFTLSRNDNSIIFYEHSLTFNLPLTAAKMELVFDGLVPDSFSNSGYINCSQYLYSIRTPADYNQGRGYDSGIYFIGNIDYSLTKWE